MGGGSLNSKRLLKKYLNFLAALALAKIVLLSEPHRERRIVSVSSEFSGFCEFYYFITVGFVVEGFFPHAYMQIMILLTELQQVKRKLAALAEFPNILCAATDCIHVSLTAAPCMQ